MREKLLGEEYSSTTDTDHKIFLVFKKKGDYDASLLHNSQVFKVYEKLYRSDSKSYYDAALV